MPLISVIIPTYNASEFLLRCLDALKKQSFEDFEVVIVNDGSTDDSGNICQRISDEDPRFKYIFIENGGVSNARNIGLKEAVGTFVCFVDADDEPYPEYLASLYDAVKNEDVDMAICDYEADDTRNHKLLTSGILDKVEGVNMLYLANQYGYQGYVWNKIFRREIIQSNNILFNEKYAYNEDRLFCLEYFCAMSGSIVLVPKPLYHYVQNNGSAIAKSNQSFNVNLISDLESSEMMLDIIRKAGFPSRTINLARDRILDSYDYIRHRMNGLNKEDAISRKKLLRLRSVKAVGGKWFFLNNRIRFFLMKQAKSILGMNVYIEK